jgi:predicted nuclease of predicted toxin-antitoxin system
MKWEQVTYPAKFEWKEYLANFEARYGFPYTKKPRYLVDENLGEGTAQLLQAWGCNVKGVWELSLTGHPDENVWRVAQKDKRVLLTHDDDFLDNRQFLLKATFGVVVLPHKVGEESLLIGKLRHLVNLLSGGAGFTYERKIVVTADSHWRIISIDETGALQEHIYDLSDLNHVYLLTDDS